MRWLVVVVFACACGPSIPRVELSPKTRDAFLDAVARHDITAIEARLAVPFEYAGMYFPDPACTQKFPTRQQIGADKRRAFAECLATLQLRVSPREGSMFGISIFDYAPGIEIEVLFRSRPEGAMITWIGYAGHRGSSEDALPTVSPGALEVVRTAGDASATLSNAVVAGPLVAESTARGWKNAIVWMKVCLDAEGTVTGAHVREASSPLAAKTFQEAIANWTFGPVKFGDRATPVCSLFRFIHPATDAPEVLPLAFQLANGALRVPNSQLERIAGETTIVPDDRTKTAIQQSGIDALVGAFVYCFDIAGAVTEVRVLESTGSEKYDARIVETMKKWRYKPYLVDGNPVVGCSVVTFIYNQR